MSLIKGSHPTHMSPERENIQVCESWFVKCLRVDYWILFSFSLNCDPEAWKSGLGLAAGKK